MGKDHALQSRGICAGEGAGRVGEAEASAAKASTCAPASSPRVRQPSPAHVRQHRHRACASRQHVRQRCHRACASRCQHVHQCRHRACASCPVVTAHAPAGVSTRASVVTVPRRELQSSTPTPGGPGTRPRVSCTSAISELIGESIPGQRGHVGPAPRQTLGTSV